MPPSKIKPVFASSNSFTRDDGKNTSQDDMGESDVGRSQTVLSGEHSVADSSTITGCNDSASQGINSWENDNTSDEMKRKRAADDWKERNLGEKEDGKKFVEESWPASQESTDQHDGTNCSTPGQTHVEVFCSEEDTRRLRKDGTVQTVLLDSQQEICQDSPEMQRHEDDNKLVISNCHPIPVIQPVFASRTTDNESYRSTPGGFFSTVQNNVNIPVRLECSDSHLTDRNEVQNVSHEEDNYSAIPLVTSREANSQGLGLVTNPPPSTVYDYAFLNLINEGTYGVVYKAMHKKTGNVVAIKMLKSENQPQGVSSTGLREVNIMLKARHINVISLREVVYGNNADKVYLVMEYAETDLKQLMYNMQRPFSVSETKCLLVQLLYAVQYLHDNAILHRDIKTENLLVNFNGILKVTDFGLARTFRKGDKHLSPVVVTLWYRAPELLLGSETYSTPVDLWSVGCVFAELLIGKPFWDGESEIDQLHQIFSDLGTPSEKIWPGYSRLPFLKTCILPEFPYNRLRRRLGWTLTELGLHLLNWFLTYSPARRVTAVQALQHWYFQEVPIPVDPQFLAGQVFRTPVIYQQCFAQGSGEPQPTMVYSHPANISYAHG
ncbi:Cyclin-dependent kinase 11B [Branchiostoma belcheri]|nr:Cyclin-dependent kinase 11B [Branchiostoma belcheri]